MLAFSVHTNAGKILSMKNPPDGTVECVHGIRVISMFWVIYGHTYIFASAYISACAVCMRMHAQAIRLLR
jgi:hypothetical protein